MGSSLGSTLLAGSWRQALAQGTTARAQNRSRLVLNVRDFGAKGDGSTKDTTAIQRALDRAGVLGGADVVVPPGRYLTGAIALRSNTTLRLDSPDASLMG